ncbi:MAG: ABC transporter permease [Gemmatimonadota bacterium]|nr:MAG: ABC transporter permease [Gemmatimonadota bacterium]
MLRRATRRLLLGFGIVLFVVTATFILVSIAPGDPARLWVAPGAGQAELDAARQALGLDRPLPVRYLTWLANFARGDWGTSLVQQRPVMSIVADALPHTLLLTAASLILTYIGGIIVGVIQALRHRTALDTGLTVTTLFVYGMPAYWLAIMLVLVFSYAAARYGWPDWIRFPALGVTSLDAEFLSPWGRTVDRIRHLALPLVTLGAIGVAGTARFVRGAVLDVRNLPFVRTARAKGVSQLAVQWRHILRNALLPLITLLGLSLPALFSGTVFVEVIFAWPGMGRIMVDAVAGRDYPIVMATTAIFALLVVIGNLLADILYAVADPRVARDGHE